MKFLVDAQLPRLLAVRLTELGQQAIHTLDLPKGNATTDSEIAKLATTDDFIVITKDADFVISHLLRSEPRRLLLVSTGNISNRNLLGLFERNIHQMVKLLQSSNFIELTADGLAVHD